jgi:hypothetical protein
MVQKPPMSRQNGPKPTRDRTLPDTDTHVGPRRATCPTDPAFDVFGQATFNQQATRWYDHNDDLTRRHIYDHYTFGQWSNPSASKVVPYTHRRIPNTTFERAARLIRPIRTHGKGRGPGAGHSPDGHRGKGHRRRLPSEASRSKAGCAGEVGSLPRRPARHHGWQIIDFGSRGLRRSAKGRGSAGQPGEEHVTRKASDPVGALTFARGVFGSGSASADARVGGCRIASTSRARALAERRPWAMPFG